MIHGSIPETVSYHVVLDGKNNPTFPRDANNPKTFETAERWISNKTRSSHWNYASLVQTEENKPQRGYKIVDLEVRDEGGRAYKVVTPHGYYVDLGEDTLMDVIENCGIIAGGELNTELIWATVSSQFKLIRFNGEAYKQILQNMNRKATKPISAKELKAGTIYEDTRGKQFLYLGLINGYDYDYRYSMKESQRIYKEKHQLWFEIPRYYSDIELSPQNIAEYYLYLEKIKSKKVIREVKSVYIDLNEIREALRNSISDSYYNWEIVS